MENNTVDATNTFNNTPEIKKRLSKTIKIALGIAVLIFVAAIFYGGIFVGARMQRQAYNDTPAYIPSTATSTMASTTAVDFGPFWGVWNAIEEKYVGRDKLDRQKMFWGAVAGIAKSLDDPYSVVFPPKEAEDFKTEMKGNFSGVGMEIGTKDGVITVVAPLKNTPAERAGIKAGDKVLKIDGKSTVDMDTYKAVSLIRGEKGTVVKLNILHKDNGAKAVDIEIVRDTIQIPIIETERKGKEGEIFVIKMYSFTENSPMLFQNAVKEFAYSTSTKMILDLRGNPGGYLDAAVDMASWFLPEGQVIVTERFGDGKENIFKSLSGRGIFNSNLKMVILVNEGSASASEILAGALKEHGIAKLVGQKTFGKGSVQELVEIPGGSSLKITVAKWLTPNGNSISEKGIEPDHKVEIKKADTDKGIDPQMEKAIEILNK